MMKSFEPAQSEHNVTRFCDNEPDIEGEILDKTRKIHPVLPRRESFLVLLIIILSGKVTES